MNIVTCPNCETRVVPKRNHQCPSCQAFPEFVPLAEPVVEYSVPGLLGESIEQAAVLSSPAVQAAAGNQFLSLGALLGGLLSGACCWSFLSGTSMNSGLVFDMALSGSAATGTILGGQLWGLLRRQG